MNKEFFIGRQPILNRDGEIFAYEILFREPGATEARITSNSAATARVLINTIQNIGLDSILNGKKGFINADDELIMDGVIDILPKESFVIEILETTKVTDALINRVIKYKNEGYSFALDDLVFDDKYYQAFHKLFSVVDYIKVDYLFCDKTKLGKNMQRFKKLDVQLLVEKVETVEDYELCKRIGFDLFQGYYFSKPVIISEKSIDPSRAAVVQLINMMNNDDDCSKLEQVVKNYPELYINLLKFMNSSAFFMREDITSVKHAINMMGRGNFSKWLYLILYAGPEGDDFDNPLLGMAQVRAKIMEGLSLKFSKDSAKADKAYLVGLISLMDAVFKRDIKDIVNEFNISRDIKASVVTKKGELGDMLQAVIYYETDDIENLMVKFDELGISFSDFHDIAIDSFCWVGKMNEG